MGPPRSQQLDFSPHLASNPSAEAAEWVEIEAMSYHADTNRYDGKMVYRRTGRSGLDLPVLSLGYWHNFGDDRKFETQREIARRAFDLGITHHDLANNYGPPYGAAEINFGRLMREDFRPYRDEMVISTKAGWDMWPGPYGQGGGGRKYMLSSLDQSLRRLNVDYVDIFYSHRLDGSTPLEETMGALDTAVRQGKALYVGISSYDADHTREAAAILGELGTPLRIHQPSYSMLNRWIEEEGLLDAAEELGIGVIGFTVLAQGLLTGRYLDGIPEGSRATQKGYGAFDSSWINDEVIGRVRELNALAEKRGQSLPQMALAWSLRDPRMTSLVIGASSTQQLEQNVDALDNLDFTAEELAEIDRIVDFASGVDEWADARTGKVGSGI
jgi:L-glyceraldehyde 3-phosphate reductase